MFVLRWDVVKDGELGAIVLCPFCPCGTGFGCHGEKEIHRPYKLPGGAPIDVSFYASALMDVRQREPSNSGER